MKILRKLEKNYEILKKKVSEELRNSLGKFTLNLGKAVEFQNKFRERLKVKTFGSENLDQVEVTEINILKKF